jgi:hypothetical protein
MSASAITEFQGEWRRLSNFCNNGLNYLGRILTMVRDIVRED